jgi:sulfur-oxidizing protein SoxX
MRRRSSAEPEKTMKTSAMFIFPAALLAASCATAPSHEDMHAKAIAMMKASFKESGQAKLDRIDQDDMQKMCSDYSEDKVMPREIAEKLEKAQQALIKYPADGKYLGDWKQGERIAQSGVGKQFTDDPSAPAGGNCYACHQLDKAELAYGTIGPSLYNFAKLRGFNEPIQRYAWGKVYNSQAFSACSSMPRFGHSGILTEEQIRHVVALLMSPESPVNK